MGAKPKMTKTAMVKEAFGFLGLDTSAKEISNFVFSKYREDVTNHLIYGAKALLKAEGNSKPKVKVEAKAKIKAEIPPTGVVAVSFQQEGIGRAAATARIAADHLTSLEAVAEFVKKVGGFKKLEDAIASLKKFQVAE